MNAATFFGQHYVEATRKPGQAPRPGMKTLADQAGDEEEPGQKIRYRCPSCEQMVTMRKMLTRARADEHEEEAGMADATCAKCGEALSLEAPKGFRWAAEAAAHFSQRYQRAVRESTLRTAHLASAMRIR